MNRWILALLLGSLSLPVFAQNPGRYRIYSSRKRVVSAGSLAGDTSYIPTRNMILVMAPGRFDVIIADSTFRYRIIDEGNSFYVDSIKATVTRYRLGTDKNMPTEGQLAFYDEGKTQHTGILAIKTKEELVTYRFRDMEK